MIRPETNLEGIDDVLLGLLQFHNELLVDWVVHRRSSSGGFSSSSGVSPATPAAAGAAVVVVAGHFVLSVAAVGSGDADGERPFPVRR